MAVARRISWRCRPLSPGVPWASRLVLAGVGVGGAYGSAVGHRADARGGVYELFVVALRGFSSLQPEAVRQQPVVDVESVLLEVVVDLELARGLPELDQGGVSGSAAAFGVGSEGVVDFMDQHCGDLLDGAARHEFGVDEDAPLVVHGDGHRRLGRRRDQRAREQRPAVVGPVDGDPEPRRLQPCTGLGAEPRRAATLRRMARVGLPSDPCSR